MPWKKLGLIHRLDVSPKRSTTHMQVPAPLIIGSAIRIYFAARNPMGKSYPAFLDVSITDPLQVLQIDESPAMHHGPPGTFDDEGIMPACALHVEDRIWMYYSGWNQRKTIPYHNTTGIAVSEDGGRRFVRMFDGPILERTPHEPYMAVTPWVIRERDAWKMWYVSGLSWKEINGQREPIYAIKYAHSSDGIEWVRPSVVAVPQHQAEEACAHPSVVRCDEVYHMWFCYRNTRDFRDGLGSYRIGYARSSDGSSWQRNDHLAGIDVSNSGWDSTMICYPSCLQVKDQLLLFYNGNSFGQTGVGCAVWEGPLP